MLIGAVVFGSRWFDRARRLPGGLAAVRPAVAARAPTADRRLGAAQPARRRRRRRRCCRAWPAIGLHDARAARSTTRCRTRPVGPRRADRRRCDRSLIETLGLVAVVLVVFGLYLGAVTLAGALGGDAAQARAMRRAVRALDRPDRPRVRRRALLLAARPHRASRPIQHPGRPARHRAANLLGLAAAPCPPAGCSRRSSPPSRCARSSSATCSASCSRTTGPSRCSRARTPWSARSRCWP